MDDSRQRGCSPGSDRGEMQKMSVGLEMSIGIEYGGCQASRLALPVKKLPANAEDIGDAGFVPGLGRSSGVGNGNPLQYSYLGNPIDREAWWAVVHRIAKSWTGLSTEKDLHPQNQAFVLGYMHPISQSPEQSLTQWSEENVYFSRS